MKTIPLGPFLGFNNRLSDFALHVDKVGDFLSVAENVDIDNKGSVRRRNATKLIHALVGAHSIYQTSATTGYLVHNLNLMPFMLTGEVITLGTSVRALTSNTPVSYVAFGADLYFSNAVDSGRITAGVWYPLGINTPVLAPGAALTSIGGSLEPGWYQVGISYSNSTTGEESGISASENIQLTTTGGIRVALPTAPAGVTHINIYLSAANGSVPMWLTQVTAATATYDCIALALGRESNGRFEDVLPPGKLFMSNGRLCSFSGNRVSVGSPWRFGYYLPANDDGTSSGYLDFPAPVSVAIEAQNGTYIVAQKTHWFPGGDLANTEAMVSDAIPYGAVPGTEFAFPDKSFVGWFGHNGIVFASTSGEVLAVTADNVDVLPPQSGTSAVFESDGYQRVVSCGYCVNMENKAASTYTGWDFTSTSGDLGTKADGIYLLDTAGLVDSVVGLGKQDFGTETLKHLPAVYLGVDADEPMSLTVATPGDVEYDYDARSSGADLQIQRIDPGKGLRANWFDLTLRNTGGADFTLASVSFASTASTRRI